MPVNTFVLKPVNAYSYSHNFGRSVPVRPRPGKDSGEGEGVQKIRNVQYSAPSPTGFKYTAVELAVSQVVHDLCLPILQHSCAY